ncbi:hypothetical protein ABPG74_003982 [Tetrahymena malaccensis]
MSYQLNRELFTLPKKQQINQNNDEMINLLCASGQDDLVNLSLKFKQLFKKSLKKEVNDFQMYQNDNITFEELMNSYELEKQIRFQLIFYQGEATQFKSYCQPYNTKILSQADNNKIISPLKEKKDKIFTKEKENQKCKDIKSISVPFKQNILNKSQIFQKKKRPKILSQEKNIQFLYKTPQKIKHIDQTVIVKQNQIIKSQTQSEQVRVKTIKQNSKKRNECQSAHNEYEIGDKKNRNMFVLHNNNIDALITIKDNTIFYEIQNIVNKFIDENHLL